MDIKYDVIWVYGVVEDGVMANRIRDREPR
jgi:hypothetical protein